MVFGIPENGFLSAPAVVKQYNAFSRFSFVGHDDFVVIEQITWLKQMQL